MLYPVFFQVFEAITFYDRFSELSQEELNTLAETFKTLAALALTQEANFKTLKLWLDAEASRAGGDKEAALSLYDDAIAAALEVDYIHIAACMGERCAKMLNSPKLAAGYLIEARDLWLRWGCQPKVAAMAVEHPSLFPTSTALVLSSTGSTSSHGTELNGHELHPASLVGVGEMPEPHPNHEDTDPASSHREDASSTTTWTYDRPTKPKRTQSGGSQGSHSHSTGTGEGHEGLSEHRGSMASHSEHMPRSHLATELDLRTVVSASSVISMELSVDG